MQRISPVLRKCFIFSWTVYLRGESEHVLSSLDQNTPMRPSFAQQTLSRFWKPSWWVGNRMRNYTPGTRGFFSRLTGSFVSSAAGRHVFGGRPKTRAANLAPTIEKLQYLYENLMSNNFFKTAVLKKNMNICKLKLHNKGFYQQIFWAVTALKFQQTLALDFPHICLQFFPGNFSRLEEKFLQTNV